MIKLLQIEFYKLWRYKTFWFFLLAYALIFMMMSGTVGSFEINGQQMDTNNFYRFPDVWHNLSYLASYLDLLLGILIILLICNEFTYRTFRKNVIDGLSRGELVISKLLLVVLIAFICAVFIFGYALFKGLVDNQHRGWGDLFEHIYYPALLFIQIMGYMSIAALIAFLFRRTAISILVFLAYTFVIEPILRLKVPDNIDRFFPAKAMNSLITLPGKEAVESMTGIDLGAIPLELAVLVSLAYIGGLFFCAYLLIKKLDL